MNETQKTVLDMTSAALFGKTIQVADDTDWSSVYDEIKRQHLVPLLFPLTADLDVPGDVMKRWSEDRDKYLLNNARNIGAHFLIQNLLDDAGIPCVILKGLASASYYPEYLLRAFGDVDFLVADNDYIKTADFLTKNGFEYVSEHDKHKIYLRDGVTYEMHRDIVGVPDTPITNIFNDHFSDIFENAITFTHDGMNCKIPSDRHHAVILLVHTAEHLAEVGVGLRHLCDWAAFVGRMSDSFFEDEMQPILRKMGIWHFAGILTELCTEHLGLRRCGWADATSPDRSEVLIEDILISGDFGRNYENAQLADPSLRTRNSDLLQARTLKAFPAFMNELTRAVIPGASRCPLLLLLGWVYIPARYLVRILTGKRTATMARNLIVKRGRRRDITQDWHLFEPED